MIVRQAFAWPPKVPEESCLGDNRELQTQCGTSLSMKSKLLTNITPGEILVEEFLKPMGITQYRLAKDIGVPPRRINEIVKGQRAITADTVLRRGRYLAMFATVPGGGLDAARCTF